MNFFFHIIRIDVCEYLENGSIWAEGLVVAGGLAAQA